MSLSVQLYTILSMVAMGGWLGAALDTYKRLVSRKKPYRLLTLLNDVLFWVVQSLIVFYVLLIVNQGIIRFYIFLALLCGYSAYQSLIKSAYLMVLERLIYMIIGIYKFFIRMINLIIVKPIKLLLQFLIATVLFIVGLVSQLVIVLFKIIFAPFRWLFHLICRLLPEKVTINVQKVAGFLNKIKNIIFKWRKK